jgi:hypothetical protein
MKKLLILFSVILVFALGSCIFEPKYETPIGENVIPPDSLELMIYDVHLADAIITSKIMKTKDNAVVDSLVYVSVFKKYNYTREQFEQTLLYYVHHEMDSLNAIYERVINRYSVEKGKIY